MRKDTKIRRFSVKPQRIWASTTLEVYERLLKSVASTVTREGKKIPIGVFIEQAVIEKLDRLDAMEKK